MYPIKCHFIPEYNRKGCECIYLKYFSMVLKSVLFFSFMLFSYFITAQNSFIEKEFKEIDSLIEYHHLPEAKEKADKLQQLLLDKYKGKKYLEQQLNVKFRQGIIIDKQFDHKTALPIFLEALTMAEKNKLNKIACEANIAIAFNHEKTNNFDISYKYLKTAHELCNRFKLSELSSSIYIRYALLYRYLYGDNMQPKVKQYFIKNGFIGNTLDSAIYYTAKTMEYAQKYNNKYILNEAYLTMGILMSKNFKNRIPESNEYYIKAIPYFKKVNNYDFIVSTYNNILVNYLTIDNTKQALNYSDSAYHFYYDKVSNYYRPIIPLGRSNVFKQLGKFDSAYHYLKIANHDNAKGLYAEEVSETKILEEQYQYSKKEAETKNREMRLIFIIVLLSVIAFSSVLLYQKNRKINSQNRIINQQVEELNKTLEQKQMLLAELQHRVKNNLQHVISILEIQKESADFNNIDELIRGNQNRIHSMALLHKKLSVSENVDDIDLNRYITELAQLVKDSYQSFNKTISLIIECEVKKISIEKALPIGLIIVELVSNSMKYAFIDKSIGIIKVEIKEDENIQYLRYLDNGNGFDFNKNNVKGLGLEIIKGLIDQLNGKVKLGNGGGFDLTIIF